MATASEIRVGMRQSARTGPSSSRPLPALSPRSPPGSPPPPSRRLCSEWGDTGPVALKGVASGEDAKRAMETGFGAVWVSNHGGRQLEDSVATFDVLPEVRKAVGPDVEVILDGGVRRGIDVVKAIARGADSVACGRAYLFGLAAGGFNGVDKSLSLLSRDLYLAMGLLGCRSVAELKEKAPLALKKADPWGEQFPGKSM